MRFPWGWILVGSLFVTCLYSSISFLFISPSFSMLGHLSHWQAIAWLTIWDFRVRPEGLKALTHKAFFLWPEYILYLYLSQPDTKLEKNPSNKLLVPKGSQCHKSNYYSLSWGKKSCKWNRYQHMIKKNFPQTGKKAQNNKFNEQSPRQERKAGR